MLVRLNKYLADCGIGSRRQADKMIEEGQVTVNGKRVYELGVKVDPRDDKVLVNGKPIRQPTMKLYIMFNKPTGVLTTMDDPLERPTIKQYIKKVPLRVFPIGRLDWDSEGLILLTNDGDYAQKVMHPKEEVTKTYLVKLQRAPSSEQIQKLLRGVSIPDGKVAAKSILKISRGKEDHPWYKIVITEGKNRQIRYMFEKIGNDVLKLQRVAIGCLRIGSLKKGAFVYLNDVAKDRVFQPDMPEEVQEKKSYKGRSAESVSRGVNKRFERREESSTRSLKKVGRKRPVIESKKGTKRNPVFKKSKDIFGDD